MFTHLFNQSALAYLPHTFNGSTGRTIITKEKNLTYAYDCLLYQLGMKISLPIGIAPRSRRSPHTYHCFKITEGEDHIFN